MDWTAIGLITSVCVNFVAIYGAFRKTRTKANAADAEVAANIEQTVIARWQQYAAEQEAARKRESEELKADIRGLRGELDETRAENVQCQKQSARQEEQILHLTGEVKDLRAALKRAGIRPGTDTHTPHAES